MASLSMQLQLIEKIKLKLIKVRQTVKSAERSATAGDGAELWPYCGLDFSDLINFVSSKIIFNSLRKIELLHL